MAMEFTFGTYMRDRVVQVVIGVCCLAVLAFMLAVLNVNRDATVLVVCVVASCFAAMLAAGYLRRKRFYRELEDLIERLDGSCRASALIDEPEFLEGKLAWRALDASERMAADEATLLRAQSKAYRDYIELWIHEIKTPIAAANLMTADLHGVAASKVKGEIDRIEAYVEQALYYARSTSLSRDYAIREVALASIVRDACKKNVRYLVERGATPSIELSDEVVVFADASWLAFMLGQIVVNAAKYGAASIRFSVREEGVGTSSAHTVLEVVDDGSGIPAEDVPRVFDRGFTGANGRAQGSATGMGLYLVAMMCEKMGLGVALASEEGTGTRVMLSFPHDRRRQDALAD